MGTEVQPKGRRRAKPYPRQFTARFSDEQWAVIEQTQKLLGKGASPADALRLIVTEGAAGVAKQQRRAEVSPAAVEQLRQLIATTEQLAKQVRLVGYGINSILKRLSAGQAAPWAAQLEEIRRELIVVNARQSEMVDTVNRGAPWL